jgi:CRISPR-associated endonuclease/helicase Cas3
MITDLAPIDLVLQRSGRLWRHERGPRPVGVGMPAPLWICLPRISGEGLPKYERGFEYIYDSHVLFRTWLTLRDRACILVPGEVEELVEAVYRKEEPWPELAEPLRRHWVDTWNDYRAARKEERSKAKECRLKSPGDSDAELWELTINPQEEYAPDLHVAHQAQTRLSEPTIQVICLTPKEAVQLVGDKDGKSAKPPVGRRLRELLRRAVTLSDWRIVKLLTPDDPPGAWRESALLRHYRLIRLDENGVWTRDGLTLRIEAELGVVISQ